MNDDLRFAHELADLADPIAMSLFRSLDLRVERKADLTEVTQADRQVEERIREHVGRRRPSDTVLGEEFGGDLAGTAGSRWIIDPIDGTRSFIRGYETWASLIALQHDGITVCAVASVPALGQRYAAARDNAFFNGCAGGVHGIFHTGFRFLHFGFGRGSYFDHGHAAYQLGQPLLQLLAVVVAGGLVDLAANFFHATLDISGLAFAFDDGRVVFVDGDFLGLS